MENLTEEGRFERIVQEIQDLYGFAWGLNELLIRYTPLHSDTAEFGIERFQEFKADFKALGVDVGEPDNLV